MVVKEQILKDVKKMENPRLLNQLFGYLRLVQHTQTVVIGNRKAVLQYAGILSDSEAKQITQSINSTFNSIEGEW